MHNTKDELLLFIESQKRKLEKDRRELQKSGLLDNGANNKNFQGEQHNRFQGRDKVTTPDVFDAYAELLRRKRAEEKSYRNEYDSPEETADSRKVHFLDPQNKLIQEQSNPLLEDENGLFEWAREKGKKDKRQASAGSARRKDETDDADIVNDDTKRAKSVPPRITAGIFGSHESPSASKRKKEVYKQELEKQIKEKEEQKLRDKLRRMGRLSSASEITPEPEKQGERSLRTASRESAKANTSPRNNAVNSTAEINIPSRRMKSQDERQRYYNYEDEDAYLQSRTGTKLYIDGQRSQQPIASYNPYLQMMPGRFDMRMDPYLMHPGGFEAFRRYHGILPEHDVTSTRNTQTFDRKHIPLNSEFDSEILQDRNRQQRLKSPAKDDDSPRNISKNSNQKSKKFTSPRGATISTIFGQSEETDKDLERSAKLAYQDELKKQMQEKQAAKEKEKKEQERYNAKLEAEIAIYDPWGRSGGGAPMRDQRGHVLADLRVMHKNTNDNDLHVRDNEASLTREMSSALSDVPVLSALENLAIDSKFTEKSAAEIQLETPRNEPIQRGAALKEIQGQSQSQVQKEQQLDYQNYLRQQIEERKKIKLEEERKKKEEDEKESKRLEEQRLKMEREFLEEQEKERRKEKEIKKQNDELRKAAEEKRMMAQRERKAIEDDRADVVVVKQKSSSELQSVTKFVESRSSSPPIPTLAKQPNSQATSERHFESTKIVDKTSNGSYGSNVQLSNIVTVETGDEQRQKMLKEAKSKELLDVDLKYLKSIREQLSLQAQRNDGAHLRNDSTVKQDSIIKQLDALRKQLSSEEKKVQFELEKNLAKYEGTKARNDSPRTEIQPAEVFGKARIRRGSFTKKPVIKVGRAVDEFTKLTDKTSVKDFKMNFPTKPVTSSDLDLQQKEFIRLQEQKLHALQQAIDDTSNHLMSNINNDHRPATGKQRKVSKQSLLESESKFFTLEDSINFNERVPNSRQSSTRSKRSTTAQKNQSDQKPKGKPGSPGGLSFRSMTADAIESIAAKNKARLKQLTNVDDQSGNDSEDAEEIINNYMQSTGKIKERPWTKQSERSLPSESTLQK